MISPYLGLALLVVYLITKVIRERRRPPLPPGPKGLPLLGNVMGFPNKKQAQVFRDWAEEYNSPIVHTSVLGQHILILNTQAAAVSILDKKGSIYSDRPHLTFASELIGYARSLALGPSSLRLRTMRRHVHSVIGARSISSFGPLIDEETSRFLEMVRERPEQWREGVRWLAGAIIMRLTYGYTVKERDDPNIQAVDEAMEDFSSVIEPGRWIVDLIPALKHIPKWMPGGGFHQKAEAYRAKLPGVVDKPWDEARLLLKTEKAKASLVSNLLAQHPSPTEEEEELMKWTASSMYGGGSDTTVSALSSFVLAMCRYPEVQTEARAAVEAGDESYVDALIKEVLRWGNVGPLGLPHRLGVEDEIEWEGNTWRVPKDTFVFVNIWSICRNPSIYPYPHAFAPSRFLGSSPQTDPRNTVFGYGRRICPGSELAERSMRSAIVGLLRNFDIRSGEGGVREVEWTDSTICHPMPFDCRITPRRRKGE